MALGREAGQTRRRSARLSAIVALLLLAFLIAPLGAQEAGADDDERRHGTVFAETGALMSSSWFALYLGSEPHVLWKPSWFGAGAGVRFSAGASQFDLHAAPFARLEAGWWYVNAGWSFELLDLTSRFQLVKDGVYLATGVAPDLLQFGYGRLGLDLGLESFVPLPYPPDELPPAVTVIGPLGLPGWLEQPLLFLAETSMWRAGVHYTFPL